MIRVLHVCSGDLWAGAEVQASLLISRQRASDAVEPAAFLFNEGELASSLRRAGIPVFVSPESEHGLFRLARDLRAAIASTEARVLHSHGYKETFVGVLGARGASPRPAHVRTVHSSPEPVLPGRDPGAWLVYRLDRFLLRNALDHVIAVSADLEARLRARLRASALTRVENGIASPRVDPRRVAAARRTAGASEGEILVGAAGRLLPVKGIDVLIDAVSTLPATPPVRVAVFGDGSERGALETRARGLPVRFLGHVDNISEYLAALDILVLPSRHEGMPMVLLEGMALGLPIVATRVGGIPEALESDRCGLLVPSEDPAAMGGAIHRLAADPELRARLGREAKARADSSFSAERMARRTHEVYVAVSERR